MMKSLNYCQFHLVHLKHLINLTAAYAPFVNGGKKIDPNLISRIQDRRGQTIFQLENRKCLGAINLLISHQIFLK